MHLRDKAAAVQQLAEELEREKQVELLGLKYVFERLADAVLESSAKVSSCVSLPDAPAWELWCGEPATAGQPGAC